MDKDELRELIATEVQKIFKVACKAAVDTPIDPSEVRYAMSPEGMRASQERKKELTRITNNILSAIDEYVRESEARIVEKQEPERANIIRKLKPTF